jgi:hypothetical protein
MTRVPGRPILTEFLALTVVFHACLERSRKDGLFPHACPNQNAPFSSLYLLSHPFSVAPLLPLDILPLLIDRLIAPTDDYGALNPGSKSIQPSVCPRFSSLHLGLIAEAQTMGHLPFGRGQCYTTRTWARSSVG